MANTNCRCACSYPAGVLWVPLRGGVCVCVCVLGGGVTQSRACIPH
jgi:hypothetical protein